MIVLARFNELDALLHAAEAPRKAGLRGVETYTPYEPATQGADTAQSRLPLLALGAGVVGAVGFMAVQYWAFAHAYPLNIGGRPPFSWPAYVPNAFEVGILCAVVAAFAGFMAANRLPRLYAAPDDFPVFKEASRDGLFLAVEGPDAVRARGLLEGLGARRIEERVG